jgi:hypothetical protein
MNGVHGNGYADDVSRGEDMTALEPHPIASMFPALSDGELAELAEDIRKNGLIQPITLFEGMVLDGRNRLKACGMVGVAARFEVYLGDDAQAFCISRNLARRHLTVEGRKEIARQLLERDPSRTDTAVAESTKLHYHTVRRIRRALAVERPEVATAKRIARDGRAGLTGRPPGPSTVHPENRWLEVLGRHLSKDQTAFRRVIQTIVQHAEFVRAFETPEERRKLLSQLGCTLLGESDLAA